MRKELRRIEKVLGFAIPIDGILTMAFNRPVIDVIKLDSIMCDKFKYKGSLGDFIKNKYGQEIFDAIMRLV